MSDSVIHIPVLSTCSAGHGMRLVAFAEFEIDRNSWCTPNEVKRSGALTPFK